MITIQLLSVLLLILLNGFFAMSELAVVSARKTRLQTMAESGRRGAHAALALADNPGRFLSAVQVGITLVGILSGALGGSALAGPLAEVLRQVSWLAPVAPKLAFALVVGGIAYVTLIIGELVPKQIALKRAEAIACWVAVPMSALAKVAAPLIWLLDFSSRILLRLIGRAPESKDGVTDEEIRLVVREAAQAGVVEPAEQDMIVGVMRLADRPVDGIMTPRHDIQWLDVNASAEETRARLRSNHHSRLPVCDGAIDEVLGIVQTKDLLNSSLEGEELDLRALLEPAPAVLENTHALTVLELLKQSPVHLALVVDEYGGLAGLVTTTDVLKVIVRGLVEPDGRTATSAHRRGDGSWLVDGAMEVEEVAEVLQLDTLVAETGYHTFAGWLLARFDHLPREGEVLDWEGWQFEVVDMDGYRIDKVLVIPPPGSDDEEVP